MKKIIASAVGLMLVGGVAVTTASAVESQFGGMWSLKSYFQDNFSQPDSSWNNTENRTRLYYTAKFNDNFKFVNKFEIDTKWGDNVGGDIGADGKGIFEIKHSYVDFTLGMVNTKLGIQGATIGRGFIFADDFSGAVVTGDFGSVKVPVLYAAGPQDDVNTDVTNDTHLLSTMPSFMIGDAVTLTPHATWLTATSEDTDIYWVGLDADLKLDAVTAWFTGIYNGGQNTDNDVNAFLVAAGADAGIVHGQAFYATGDDDAVDTDQDEFQSAPGQSYYWSEIMGLGMFDLGPNNNMGVNGSNNSPGDAISNVWAANLGVTVKPMDKLTLGFDAWYAQLAEKIEVNGNMENELGVELDGLVSYELMENLNADVVFAYLFAGDATGPEDVMEGGVRLSLKF